MRAKRAERNKKKELRSLAERISSYGHIVHQRYPTGDVVVSERDLAEQLRKRPDAVGTALNLLLSEQKVQRAPSGSVERVLEIEGVKSAPGLHGSPTFFSRIGTMVVCFN